MTVGTDTGLDAVALASVLDTTDVHDVDTHILEPWDLWTSRVSKKWGDLVPHVILDDAGAESWYAGDTLYCGPSERFTVVPDPDEITFAGASEPKARLEWMDRHGISSQVLYPNHLGFFIGVFLAMEPALRLECIRAYNDFLTEFASADPKRLIPMVNVPWWDVDESIAEVRRCHELGHKGVNLGWEFEKIGFPRLRDPHWDPLLKTIEELGLPINFHVGFSSSTGVDPDRKSVV
jgi:predicted TIM-barrel fold metal-dependent hydrolase